MRESFAFARAPCPMMKAVLKTLALSFGGGLALGAGIRLTQGSAKSRRREPGVEGVDLDPLLERLKSVESRIVGMETVRVESEAGIPIPSVIPEKLAVFESRLAGQLTDLERLRGQVRRVDERVIELDSQLPVIVQSTVDVRFQEAERKLQHELGAQLPVIVQSTVDVRFQEAERKLQHDFEEAQSRSMTAFVETLQTKVVERISTLETNLAEQSQAIGKLRDTSLRSDENLQKMLAGIERLVDQSRIPQPVPAPAAAAPHDDPPVAAHRDEPATMYQEEVQEKAAETAETEPALAAVDYDAVHYIQPPAVPLVPAAALSTQVAEAATLPTEVTTLATPVATLPTPVATLATKAAEDLPVPAHLPETAHAGAFEAVHTNGVVSEPPVSAPAKPVAALSTIEPAPANELPPPPELSKSDESYDWVNKIGIELLAPRAKPRLGWRIPLVVGLVAGLILIAGLLYSGILQHYFESSATPQAPTLASTAPVGGEPSPAPQNSNDLPALEQRAAANDPSALMDLGREYQRRKDWSKAEATYRSVLEANHANRDAALGLSDVLYQEQKYEESAAVLNKLSSTKSQ
jgi:uncharacterized coiled-coil protein SlyX